MSLFQCDKCGCVENTATSSYVWNKYHLKKNEDLCSFCDDTIGKWHDKFPRTFLEKGKWETNRDGNLQNIDTGETDFSKYIIKETKK